MIIKLFNYCLRHLLTAGVMFFAIGRELLSGNSPSGVYSKAFKMCKKNEQVCDG